LARNSNRKQVAADYAVPSVSKLSHQGMNIFALGCEYIIPGVSIYSSWGMNISSPRINIFIPQDEYFHTHG